MRAYNTHATRLKAAGFIFISLLLTGLQGAELSVLETRQLSANLETPAFFPAYSDDASSIYYTASAYMGLWRLDRSSLSSTRITDGSGSGYEPLPLSDGSVIYRHDSYVKGRKYTALFRQTNGSAYQLTEPARFVSAGSVHENKLTYLLGETLKVLDLSSEEFEAPHPELVALLNDKLSLKLLSHGKLTDLSPLGEGNYIWSELSPQTTHVVFSKVGEGTFVCDLSGKITAKLGKANAPHWSPDGRFLVYMVDLDDGINYTSSEIWVTNSSASRSWKITDTSNRIELYPRWSPDGRRIVYHTPEGEIFETLLEISE